MSSCLGLLRSLCFLPASAIADPNDPIMRYFYAILESRLPSNYAPSAFIIDLEDSVAPRARRAAIQSVKQLLSTLRPSPKPAVYLRVTCELDLRSQELSLASHEHIAAIILPKVEHTSGGIVAAFAAIRKPVLPILETARALANRDATLSLFASSEDAVLSSHVIFGRDDLAASVMVDRERLSPHLMPSFFFDFCAACRGYGLAPIAPVFNTSESVEDLMAESTAFAALGYEGALCVFPSYIRHINAAYTYDLQESSRAREILERLHTAMDRGYGWILVEGKKFDIADIRYLESVASQDIKGPTT